MQAQPTESMSVEFLIIGQGLAGSLLAWELIQRDRRIMIVDNGENNASQVAAGLVNPVTGMRFVKSPDVDTFLPIAKDVYTRLSDFFRQSFYIEKPMLRIFRSEQELGRCLQRLGDPDYQHFLGEIHPAGKKFDLLETPFGYVEQMQTGYLLTRSLLASLKNFFIEKSCYRQIRLDYRDIQFQHRLRWRDLCPEQIIFCEGFQVNHNPWFSWLPLRPVKGEILTLERPIGLPDQLINYGHWLLPVDSRQIRLGATFDRENINTVTTEEGRAELMTGCEKLFPWIRQVKPIDHQAGIRPCTLDRQPIIGKHPKWRQLAIFNGFGAKGSLLIPGYCRQFADFLLTGSPLPEGASIQRYDKTHFSG